MNVGAVGIWSIDLRFHKDAGETAEAAAELEQLGFGALWVPGGAGGALLAAIEHLLACTTFVAVGSGILNIWMHDPQQVAQERGRIAEEHPDRFLLGLGVSHAPLVDAKTPDTYRRPLSKMRAYLDALDRASPAVPVDARVLGSLGPRSLELARTRAAGAHPYFVPVEHTRRARGLLGSGPLLAPEQGVILETDPGRARALAREHMTPYLELPNYTNNLLTLGFTEDDFADHASDRLVDAIVAWGDEDAIASRVAAHREAGADHVCIQVLGQPPGTIPREVWRRLAPALVH
jgi:probable F420-dependent oxidoreductase